MTEARATPNRRRVSLPALLRDDTVFRRYWSAHTISLFGDQISMLALPLVAVLTLDAGAAQMGYLTAASWLPYLLFALHAGAWVDRRGHRRRTMIAADIGRAAVLLSVPLAYAADLLTLPHVYVVTLAAGGLPHLQAAIRRRSPRSRRGSPPAPRPRACRPRAASPPAARATAPTWSR